MWAIILELLYCSKVTVTILTNCQPSFKNPSGLLLIEILLLKKLKMFKVHLAPKYFFRSNKSLRLFETHCAFLPPFKGEGHCKKRNFLSSPIKSLYWVKLLVEVSASKVHSIAKKIVSKEAGIRSRHFIFAGHGENKITNSWRKKQLLTASSKLMPFINA